MKKTGFVLALALTVTLTLSGAVYANMAAPLEPDIASGVTFEKNEDISVVSEVIDIQVKGAQAHIKALYQMKNNAGVPVSTRTMFLSPNVKESGVNIVVNGQETDFSVESYALNYDTEVKTEDWRYAVLTRDEESGDAGQRVDAITFDMDFLPGQEYEAAVSYDYSLGGYPDYDFDAKRGEIEYYLMPAAMWKDFSGLTINLRLGEDMPVLKESNLDFQKVGKGRYQYTSDSLPGENLRIAVDENWWQNIFSILRSPYFAMTVKMLLPLILAVPAVVLVIIIRRVRKKKKGAL